MKQDLREFCPACRKEMFWNPLVSYCKRYECSDCRIYKEVGKID